MTSRLCRWRDGFRGLFAACGRLLFPPVCVHCDQELSEGDAEGFSLCPECLAKLGPEDWHGCRRCGGKISSDAPPGFPCPHCHDIPLRFDAAVALGSYHTGLRSAILRMKYPIHSPLSNAMGRLLACRRREWLLDLRLDAIVPIPMFWRRRLRRGKNCPDVLAACLSASLGVPVRRGALIRCRNTRPQNDLSPTSRFRNVQGAFHVRQPSLIRGARVLLVDDVLTTGATCSEAAKVLKRAGATMVAVAIVARAGAS